MSATAQAIDTGFRPHTHQAEVIGRMERFNVLVCHRRWGKTTLAVNLLNDGSVRCQRESPRYAYIAPLYKQAKSVSWDYLKRYAGAIPGVRFNESELRADFPNGARISLYGADNPDALRGIYLDGVVFDEVAQMPWRVWTEVIRPALADRKGWALFIGTPRGRDVFCDLYEAARDKREGYERGWYAGMYKASQTGLLDSTELAAARREMGADEYAQEFECSFTAAIKGAYYGALIADAEVQGRICTVPCEPLLPVHTAWDLGVSDSTAIWFFQQERGGGIRVIDYYEANNEGIPHYADVLNKRGYHYGRHIAPHDIRVREMGNGKSRIETAASLGIRFDVCPNIPIADGINAVRMILPRCWLSLEKTKEGLEALRHYRRSWNTRMDEPKDKPEHDWTSHAADAFRYMAVGMRPTEDHAKKRQTRALRD